MFIAGNRVKVFIYSICLILSACGEAVRAPALHDFGIINAVPAFSRSNTDAAQVKVTAPKWLAGERIRYRLLFDQPSRVRYYTLDRWLAPLPDLLELYFTSVPFDPNYELVVRLLNFEQQFETPVNAAVVLELTAEAFAADSKTKLGAEAFSLRSAQTSADAQGAVKGAAEAAKQAGERIRRWLDSLKN